ncbi:replication protein A 70 kDa DNA-binding subunit B-like [Senna tora]|uniref:Replication protein A 70 kDa DNA-binding subunit B-like n=1 Tax=Senna tora TaxID=362788 RepID=A0A834TA32_9FABA|nr:replication protein A 70 kDa DNA-binding subunit B-like [Senna tora]
MDIVFDSIRHLHPLCQNWTIKVRVVRMWTMSPMPKTSPGPSMEMVLCDREGFKIAAFAKSPFAAKLTNVPKEGSVYVMSKLNVGTNTGSFRASHHQFKLNLQMSTGLPKLTTTILFTNMDVIGRLCNMSNIHESPSSNPKSRHVNIELEDQSNSKLSVTLWGEFVNQLSQFMNKNVGGAVIIAIQYCKIKEYNGSRTLSNSMYASRMFINADIEEIRAFHDALQPEELTILVNLNNNPMVAASPLQATFDGCALSNVYDLYSTGDGDVLVFLASVLKLNSDKGWFYDSCKKCAKKIEPNGPSFYCTKCDSMVHSSVSMFKIELLVVDDSGTVNIIVFDRDATQLISMSAIELRKEHLQSVDDPRQMPEKLDAFLGQTLLFKVAVKSYSWTSALSFIVQRLTNDPELIAKYTAIKKARDAKTNGEAFSESAIVSVDLSSVDDSLITPVQSKSKIAMELDGRRPSFDNNKPSPAGENNGSGKRSITDSADGDPMLDESLKNQDQRVKRVKDEK